MSYILWIAISVIMIILEAITVTLVSIWFAFGAFAAGITSLFTDSITIQVLAFIVTSFITFITVRPIFKKLLPKVSITSFKETIVGKKGVVIEDINDLSGRVMIGDISWMAKSSDNTTIEKDTLIKVTSSSGNILYVEKL